jgi:hypothetical protein
MEANNRPLFAVLLTVSLLCVGCASTQLNYNTLDLASTYESLILKQVLYNLTRTMDDPYSIPSQIKVSAGSAQTTNSVTPTLTDPLNASQVVTNQITTAATVTKLASTAVTNANKSLSVAANDQWLQSWSLDPVSDTDELRRLRALYQYATGLINRQNPTANASGIDTIFDCTYPIIQASASSSGTPGGGSGAGSSTTVSIDPAKGTYTISSKSDSDTPKKPKTSYFARSCNVDPRTGNFIIDNNGNVSYKPVKVNPDETFIQPPGCILCDYGTHHLEKNKFLTNNWLYWNNDEPLGPDAIAFTTNDFRTIHVRGELGKALFYEFILFTQDASVQGTGTSTSSGQSNGHKTAPTQKVITPVLGTPSSPR